MIDAHTHVFPRISGYGPLGKTKSLSYGMADMGDSVPGASTSSGSKRKIKSYF